MKTWEIGIVLQIKGHNSRMKRFESNFFFIFPTEKITINFIIHPCLFFNQILLKIQNYISSYTHLLNNRERSWSWSYGNWIYNYLCNQCLSPLTFWVRIPLRQGVLDTNYVIKFVRDLRQVNGFLRVLGFPPPITLTATI